MLKQLSLAAFTAAALSAAVSSAEAATRCPEWLCGGNGNGTQLTGLAAGSASTGTVSAVILPGEVIAPAEQIQVADRNTPKPRPRPTPEPTKDLESRDRLDNFEIQN